MFISLFVIWLITAAGLAIVTLLVPGIRAKSVTDLLLAAMVLGVINAFIRPLLWILTMPLTVLSFGLFALIINAFMVKITAKIVTGFEVDSFASALLAAIIMALLAIIGFIFIQWFLFDGVFWMHMESGHSQISI